MISKILILLLVFQTTDIKPKLGHSYTLSEREESQEASREERKVENVGHELPSFRWCGQRCMAVNFPDGVKDRITLVNVYPEDEANSCIFEGFFEKDSEASVSITGCQNDPNVYITVFSKHLENRKIFNINEGVIEEPVNPYEIDYDDVKHALTEHRPKRDIYTKDYDVTEDEYKDYIEDYSDDYAEVEYDGDIDLTPPPKLILNIRLAFEETMKAKLGSEQASRRYIQSVLSHTRKHLQHSSLGTSIALNLVGPIEFVPNRRFTPTSRTMDEAKQVKKHEPWPTVFFCHTDDTNSNTGIAFIRKGCHKRIAIAIVKHRKDVNVAAITMSHEIGHLLGGKHDWKEDKLGSKACSGTGIMSSRVDPPSRPVKWSSCTTDRFAVWFKRTGKACLVEPGGARPSQLPNNGNWNLVFRQYQHSDNAFSSNEWNKGKKSEVIFSNLQGLEDYRGLDGSFHFFLWWPELGQGNEWTQLSNPVTKAGGGVDGYQAVNVSFTDNHWGGLEYNNENSLLDGSVNQEAHFYSVGSFNGDNILGPTNVVNNVELYLDANEPPKLPSEGNWIRIFREHTAISSFAAGQWKRGDSSEPNFSDLQDLEKYRRLDGSFHFFLWWPELGQGNEWTQTSNPVTKTEGGVDGYQAVNVSKPERHWGGLEYNNKNCLLDGQSSGGSHSWWYTVGSFTGWLGSSVEVKKVELFINSIGKD